MISRLVAVVLVFSFLLLIGCTAHIHKIGTGAQSDEEMQARQWYILFGLVPLNDVDTNEMSGRAENYEIKTETGVVDILLNIITGYVTITSRTVTVSK